MGEWSAAEARARLEAATSHAHFADGWQQGEGWLDVLIDANASRRDVHRYLHDCAIDDLRATLDALDVARVEAAHLRTVAQTLYNACMSERTDSALICNLCGGESPLHVLECAAGAVQVALLPPYGQTAPSGTDGKVSDG